MKTIGFVPEPGFEYGLYHYACICPEPDCSWRDESDKGMLGPERAYERHWQKVHNKQESV